MGALTAKSLKTLKTLGTVSGISKLSGGKIMRKKQQQKKRRPVIQSSIPSGPQTGTAGVTIIYFGCLLDESFFPFADVCCPMSPPSIPSLPQKCKNFIYYKDL